MNEIIVGVDGSESAFRAAAKAAAVAAARGAGIHLVTTVDRSAGTVRGGGDRWHFDSLSEGEQLLRSIAQTLPVEVVTTSVQWGDPADAMCREADRLDASMIAVGNKRVQSPGRLLGSVATKVTRHAKCDVLVVNTTVDEADEG
jgi:nucleotide-binding universal stress UspA family protein